MNLFNHHKPNQSLVNTLVGIATKLDGNLSFVGGLRVEGTIIGDVTGSENASSLVLVKQAVIEGKVTVIHAIIDGSVVGPITCDTLELKENARVVGDVAYKTLIIHQGAVIAGTMTPHSVEESTSS